MDLVVAIIAVLIGLAALFAGYRLFRELLPLFAFVVGFVAGAGFIASWLGEGFLVGILGIVIGLVLGLGFAFIAYAWWWVGVILATAGFGFALGYSVLPALGIDIGLINLLIGLAVGALFAIAAVVLRLPRVIIIVETALWGAAAVIAGVLVLFNQVDVADLGTGAVLTAIGTSVIWTIVWIIVAFVGMAAQSVSSASYELLPPEGTAFFGDDRTMPRPPDPRVPGEY